MSVRQGENGAKRRSPVRALLVQHQTACLCLSVGTSSQWTTASFDVSSGLASTSDFCWSWRIVGTDLFWGVLTRLGGSKDQGLCVSAPEGQGSSCRGQGMTVVRNYLTTTLHLNLYTARWMHNEETESFLSGKYSLLRFTGSILWQNGIQSPLAVWPKVTSSNV